MTASTVSPYKSWTLSIGLLLMTLAAFYMGFYSVSIPNQQAHKTMTTANLGEGFFEKWFLPYHNSSTLKYWAFVLHVVPGGVVFFLTPLQFIQTLRKTIPALHRFMGYLTLTSVCISVPAALWLLTSSLMGPICALTSLVVGVWCLFCVYRAWETARAKDFVSHRKFTIRMWSVCFGIFVMRIFIGMVKNVFYPEHAWLEDQMAMTLFSIEFVVGWAMSCGFGELYLKMTSWEVSDEGKKSH
ncbi:hypothetical protein C9374_012002 [Naegleria lovaniensis]|uniref:Uncharacterized protein n=1 Tax=Naegleria lovaniensis TaxID=51637 RepID=A0AA88GDJ0_NAELO|nr:uncharacterized protein C9374_012002 [Naegleria lovaniensis]KAG2373539.1 hypothetical protein C9374_012002 [Naegleria lovaniensis]